MQGGVRTTGQGGDMITNQWMRLANFGALEVVVILLVKSYLLLQYLPNILMLKLKYDNLSLKKTATTLLTFQFYVRDDFQLGGDKVSDLESSRSKFKT